MLVREAGKLRQAYQWSFSDGSYQTVVMQTKPKELRACTTDPELLTRPEMADRLNISVRSLDRMIRAKQIPHLRIGGLVRLSPVRVLEAIHRNLEIKEIGA